MYKTKGNSKRNNKENTYCTSAGKSNSLSISEIPYWTHTHTHTHTHTRTVRTVQLYEVLSPLSTSAICSSSSGPTQPHWSLIGGLMTFPSLCSNVWIYQTHIHTIKHTHTHTNVLRDDKRRGEVTKRPLLLVHHCLLAPATSSITALGNDFLSNMSIFSDLHAVSPAGTSDSCSDSTKQKSTRIHILCKCPPSAANTYLM